MRSYRSRSRYNPSWASSILLEVRSLSEVLYSSYGEERARVLLSPCGRVAEGVRSTVVPEVKNGLLYRCGRIQYHTVEGNQSVGLDDAATITTRQRCTVQPLTGRRFNLYVERV